MFADDAWLSGFIDGGGCFTHCSGVRRKDGTRKLYPRFRIGDDRSLLHALQQEFGGSVSLHKPEAYVWVATGDSLKLLIAYLERYPLRAQKAHQFAEWRRRFSL